MGPERLNSERENLWSDLLQLGNNVELALNRAVKSLVTRDSTAAAWIVQDDIQLNYARYELEAQVAGILARQQPGADDKDLFTLIILIATELEHIGSYASIIARRVERMVLRPVQLTPPAELFEMTAVTQQMLRAVLEALQHHDCDRARGIAQQRGQMYGEDHDLRLQLINLVRGDKRQVDNVVALFDIVYALERITERTIAISESIMVPTNAMMGCQDNSFWPEPDQSFGSTTPLRIA